MVAAGLPLAAGFRGGFGVLVGPTGGYLAGFPLAAFLMSLFRELHTRAAGKSFAELEARDVAALWLLSAAAAAPDVYAALAGAVLSRKSGAREGEGASSREARG